jgi:hypothetical protein
MRTSVVQACSAEFLLPPCAKLRTLLTPPRWRAQAPKEAALPPRRARFMFSPEEMGGPSYEKATRELYPYTLLRRRLSSTAEGLPVIIRRSSSCTIDRARFANVPAMERTRILQERLQEKSLILQKV